MPHWLDIAGPTDDRDERPRPHSDMLVPRYDRRPAVGQFCVVWLVDGGVVFSDRCPDRGTAIRMTAQYRRAPAWVVHGLDQHLVVVELCLRFRVPWMTSALLDRELAGMIDVTARRNVRRVPGVR